MRNIDTNTFLSKGVQIYYYNIILLLALLGGTIGNVQAAPRVIADLGGESAVRYYDTIQPVHTDDAPQHPHAVPQTFSEKDLLPIVSHKWQVGPVEPKPINLPGASPLFLIGADDISRQWLSQNREKLASLQAVGFVINITTEAELAELRQIAPELTLMLSAADNLAERLELYHYPVLITTEGISQ